jgi:hypothetical protein
LIVEPGLYVTFFTAGEPPADELPAVGPFDYLVVRPGALVADRSSVSHSGEFGGFRWIEAELELQRALGHEPGGVRRPDLRIAAPQGVYLRFASFDSAAEEEAVPELGPYAVITVTRHGIEADGDAIASRSATKDRAWVILRGGGPALVGIIRPDIAFRTRSTNYHPQIHQARLLAQPGSAPAGTASAVRPAAPTPAPGPEPVRPPERIVPPATTVVRPAPVTQRPAAPVAPPQRPVTRPPVAPVAPVIRPPAAPALTPAPPPPTAKASAPSPGREALDDRAATEDAASLRARLGGALRTDAGGTRQTPPSADELSRRTARRWAGFVLVAALILGLGAFGALTLRGSPSTPGTTGGNVVAIGKTVNGTQFDYAVASVSRGPTVGAAHADGSYVIVFVTATNRGSAGAALTPTAFRLIDSAGTQHPPLSESDLVYKSDSNPGSPLVWVTSYPVGRAVSTPVVFDVGASLRGLQLSILEVPTVRVRLD